MRFINAGNKPITPEDFDWSVHIEIQGGQKYPLSAGVSETSGPDLRAEVTMEPDGCTLEPLLLNPGDWVTMSLLLDGKPASWKVRGRVVGVKEFRPYQTRRRPSMMLIVGSIVGATMAGGFTGWLFKTSPRDLAVVSIGLVAAFVTAAAVRPKLKSSRRPHNSYKSSSRARP